MDKTIIRDKIKPNEKQLECINNITGKYLVLAGPGTGKTFTLVNRIENMLIQGINPASILCLTYSDAAAGEMKERLIKKMGVLASSVDIFTYHSFCNNIIKLYPQEFDLALNFRLITQSEKNSIMKECVDCANLEYFIPQRADRYYYVGDFILLIEKLKSSRITKEDYLNCIDLNPELMPEYKKIESQIYENEQKGNFKNKERYKKLDKIKINIEKARELWHLKELYEAKMQQNNVIDFSDMINFVIEKFIKDKDFLKNISNKYEYFLIDEYQDTNQIQNEIIFNLVDYNQKKNILVVGDDDQIIYGFQGARIDTIEKFLLKYPDTKIICLTENNRSTKSILDFSYELIKQDELRLENNSNFSNLNISKKLTAKNPSIIKLDKKVNFIEFTDILQENNYIVEKIENLINSPDYPRNDNNEKDLTKIAIITKKNDELIVFDNLLRAKNILTRLETPKSIFSIRASIAIYFYLKALNNHILSSDKLFSLLLLEPFKIELEDYNKILHQKKLYKKDTPQDFITIMETLCGWKNEEKIKKFLNTFYYLKNYSSANNLRNTIIELINRTGILAHFLNCAENTIENISAIKKMISIAEDLTISNPLINLSNFVQYLDDCLNNNLDIKIDKSKASINAIQLTTYHSAKGREFDYVFLPNLISKKWEDYRNPREYKLISDEVYDEEYSKKKKDSELLKLLFVGITRAKHSLTLSFADNNDTNTQQITKYLYAFSNYDFNRLQFLPDKSVLLKEFTKSISKEVFDNQKALCEEIKNCVKDITLSPTSLNDYLNCPRKFLYSKVLEIDIFDKDNDSANFGTIIHSLLEKSAKFALDKGFYINQNDIKNEFFAMINSQAFFSEVQKEKFTKHGFDIFDNYYPKFIEFPISKIFDVEFRFEGIKAGEEFIKGKIDRIEKNSDGTFNLYDYKTGISPSIKQICPKGTKENYFNQLCFYKYAFEKMTSNKVSKVGLIYPEESKTIDICPDYNDMIRIEKLIIESGKNLKALNFTPSSYTESCTFCPYKELCKLDII